MARNKKQGGRPNKGGSNNNAGGNSVFNLNPNLTKAAANISWYPTTGTPFYGTDAEADELGYYGTSLPGIMMLEFVPSYGVSNNPDSPLNFLATQLFTIDRAANSGRVNYEHTTFFMYNVAVDSLIMFWNHVQRALQLINCYSVYNRYVPKILIEALGFDYEDMMSNQANLKLWMNTYAKQISVFKLPRSCELFVRHSYMCSNIYRDQNSERSQLYAFKPQGYYVFDQTSDPGKTMLKYHTIASHTGESGLLKMNSFVAILEEMVQGLVRSTDVNIMIGDIMKAWGNNVMSVNEFSDISLSPVYNEEVLRQIHNADISVMAWKDLDITQNMTSDLDPYIVATPHSYSQGYDSHIWLDTTEDATDPVAVMNMTRLKNQPYTRENKQVDGFGFVTENTYRMVGTELISDCRVYFMENVDGYWGPNYFNPMNWYRFTSFADGAGTLQESKDKIRTRLQEIAMYNSFNYAPMVPIYSYSYSIPSENYLLTMMGACDTVTTIDEKTLYNIHYTAMLSLLGL